LAGLLFGGILLPGLIWGAPLRPDTQENKLDRAFLARFGRDFGSVVTAPARWKGSDFLTAAAVSAAGLLVLAFDGDIQDWAQQSRDESSDRAAAFLRAFGDGAVLTGISAALYAAGAIGRDDGWRKTALLSLESLATASFLVWTTKVIVGRARPYSGESSGSFHPFSFKSRFWSFPSGHAAAAFSVATAIALQSKSGLVDAAAYSLAALAGLSRVHDNKHWTSDVFIGSVLGFFVAQKIAHLNKPGEGQSVRLGFQSAGGRHTLTLSLAF
jgi:hypothetical protein